MRGSPIPSSISLEYESHPVQTARAISIERPTIEMLAILVLGIATMGLGSLSWWMALHP